MVDIVGTVKKVQCFYKKETSDHFSEIPATPLKESFRVIRPNLLEVRARTDPDLPGMVIFYL